VFLVTATRGEGGRLRGHPPGHPQHPGAAAVAAVREQELNGAAAALGIREVTLLGFQDGQIDRVDPREASGRIAAEMRRLRPDVVMTFGPDGAYGHPDHIAISQFTTAAILRAGGDLPVSKLYYLAWPQSTWTAYEAAVKKLTCTVDGVVRQATPWPDWAITTSIDARQMWPTVWRAVSCHQSQLTGYGPLSTLPPEHHEAIWGRQSFYRVFSLVNGGRDRETDLFEGL
jgi:LmbE family N-acetylglucosaminyl deacetylase